MDTSELNTCYPGRIVTFDPLTQTATVQLMLEAFFSTLSTKWEKDTSPPLIKVPCHFPKGGGHSITMPVVTGDDCLVMFSQRGYDHWLYKGLEESEDIDGRPSADYMRKFSKSDALALIGFGSGLQAETPKTIAEFNIDAIEIRNADRTQRISLMVESKDIEVVTDTNLTATVTGDTTATIGGVLTAAVTGNIEVTSEADINITAAGVINITGATVNINS